MIFRETPLKGAYQIDLDVRPDVRGFFARTFCRREFESRGLDPGVAQCSLSYNRQRGTLRGMHYQQTPHEEAKLVRCVRGALYDVIVDLRRDSPTFRQWAAFELRAEPGRPATMVYIPPGFAHGFQTLEDDTEVLYQMSEFHAPEAQRGFRWNDPAFAIRWPEPVQMISERDRTFPDFFVTEAAIKP
jgi:dTDP-4-dehydrorhamnose 3,5-epimerase